MVLLGVKGLLEHGLHRPDAAAEFVLERHAFVFVLSVEQLGGEDEGAGAQGIAACEADGGPLFNQRIYRHLPFHTQPLHPDHRGVDHRFVRREGGERMHRDIVVVEPFGAGPGPPGQPFVVAGRIPVLNEMGFDGFHKGLHAGRLVTQSAQSGIEMLPEDDIYLHRVAGSREGIAAAPARILEPFPGRVFSRNASAGMQGDAVPTVHGIGGDDAGPFNG